MNALSVLREAGISALDALAAGFQTALPRFVTGLVFLTVAYVAIKVVLRLVRTSLDRLYPEDQALVVSLLVTVVAVFLWFGVGLTLLKIVGMGDVAASLGTATGFVALGVSYALSNMIADVVAGVYLLRDPDFTPGDRIVADGVTGELRSIELRKSRFRNDEGETVVVANRDVEKRWRRVAAAD
ncbi:MAG: mechanosensitive ion channel domain-containing protein [Haloferacaceae archaeon]